jgi:HEAT repeat protein
MVAAQQLGKSKQGSAGAALGAALDDDDEMVASTAIAALSELKAVDQVPALRHALGDPRWRVRAAAAETLGALKARDAITVAALTQALDDADAFVARSALNALGAMDQAIGAEALRALAARQPDLLNAIAALCNKDGKGALLGLALELFQAADSARRAGMLQAMVERYPHLGAAEVKWTPLLDAAAADASAQVRLACIDLLRQRSSMHGRRHCVTLLNDDEPAVRAAAQGLCAFLLEVHAGGGQAKDPDKGCWDRSDQATALAETYRSWLEALPDNSPMSRLLRFVITRRLEPEPEQVPDQLAADVIAISNDQSLDTLALSLPVLAIRLLPWPAAREQVALLLQDGAGAAALIAVGARRPDLTASLTDPALAPVMLNSLVACELPVFMRSVEVLLEQEAHPLLLHAASPSAGQLRNLLLQHEAERLRALGVFASCWRTPFPIAELAPLAHDASPLVRQQLAAGLALAPLGPQREALLLQLLDDLDDGVLVKAIAGLLDQGSAEALDLEDHWRRFTLGEQSAWINSSGRKRLFAALGPRLDDDLARRLLARHQASEAEETRQALVMLLLDGGQGSLIKGLVAGIEVADLSTPMLIRLALIEGLDPRFQLEAEQRIRSSGESYETRQWLGLMSSDFSPGARQLRRLINRRLQESE